MVCVEMGRRLCSTPQDPVTQQVKGPMWTVESLRRKRRSGDLAE